MTAADVPAELPVDLAPADGAGDSEMTAAPLTPEQRRRRRRLIVLFILTLFAILLIGFSAWYLWFRKPVSEIIPPFGQYTPPALMTTFYSLDHPSGVAVTADGSRIYVTQTQGGQVTKILDGVGNEIGQLAPPTEIALQPDQIYAAVDPRSGDVYASDRQAGAIYVYAANGSFKQVFEPNGVADGWQPLALAFDSAGQLYVSDVGGAYHSLHVFGADGRLIRDIGSDGVFDYPNGISVDRSGYIYVSDSNNGRLLVFDRDGHQVASVRRGQGLENLGLPRGVAIDDAGRVHVVDTSAGDVQVFRTLVDVTAADLDYLGNFGLGPTAAEAMQYPNGIAVDQRGRLYVADWANDRVQVWSY